MNIYERLRSLVKKETDQATKDVAEGFDPNNCTQCEECGGLRAYGPFEQLLVAANALRLSLEDPTGCPEKNVDEVEKMIARLCDIWEGAS